MSKSSNEKRPFTGTTISPSITNCFARSLSKASTSSGKYRPSGCPLFDCNDTSLPSRKAMQRKPSHFGSYCQVSPAGSCSTDFASIGRYVCFKGRDICLFCFSLLPNPLPKGEGENSLQIGLKSKPIPFVQERLPKVAQLLNSRAYVVQAEVFNSSSAFNFFPRHRC